MKPTSQFVLLTQVCTNQHTSAQHNKGHNLTRSISLLLAAAPEVQVLPHSWA